MRAVKHLILAVVHIVIYAAVWAIAQPPVWLGTVLFAGLLIWVSCRDFAVFEVPDLAAMGLIVTGVVLAENPVIAAFGAVVWGAVFLAVEIGARRGLGRA
ncbi:MAG: hypothetical protein AAFN94_12570, partial [Pseudomonadota bacterium]